MATVFRLPDLGEGLTEAEIIEWHAEVGDEVSSDAPLVTVETDKTQAVVPAPASGVLLHQGGTPGTTLEVGAVLAVIGEPGEMWGEEADQGPDEAWGLAPVEQVEVESPEPPGPIGRTRTLPLVRRLANEHSIDLNRIVGSGPAGRITRADVEMVIAATRRPAEPPETVTPTEEATKERPPLVGTLDEDAEDLSTPVAVDSVDVDVDVDVDADVEVGARVERLSATRRAIADRMSRSWREIPHVTTFGSFDATRLLEVRKALASRHDVSIPLEALLVKAVIPALRAHPEFNATLDEHDLTLHGRHDLGVAVDGPDGLLVVVVRDASGSPLLDVASMLESLVDRARQRSLTRDEMTGQTFTISNIGAIGGGQGTPIIPYGTTAILSVGRAAPTPVARDGAVAIAPMAPLSLSYDHRVVDGAVGRRFLSLVVENLEEPALFLA